MIQFNLLPDIKLEYIKTRRTKRTIMFIVAIVTGASLAITVILFLAVSVFQAKNLRDIDKDIKEETVKMEGFQDLNKILTIQNQLSSLPGLHDRKPVVTRLYTYLLQVVPKKVSVATLTINFETQTMEIIGTSDSPATTNKFVDTLKFADYTLKTINADGQVVETTARAFSDVVLTGHGRDKKTSSYNISFKFDPVIFSINSDVRLVIQKGLITTRSETEKPTEGLFQPLEETDVPGAQP